MRTAELSLVDGAHAAEDIVRLPGTRWIVASGLSSATRPTGALHLVDTHHRLVTAVTVDEIRMAWDDAYPLGAAPDLGMLSAHGLALGPGSDGAHLLYVVNHGGREAIEVFSIDVGHERPRFTWLGAIAQDDGVRGNAVAALPSGGVVSTKFFDTGDSQATDKLLTARLTGCIKEWDRATGWSDVPDSQLCGANGVAASTDGVWIFAASWGTGEVVRLRRGTADSERRSVDVGFLPDNVKLDDRGLLTVTGQDARPEEVLAASRSGEPQRIPVAAALIDPVSLEVVDSVRLRHPRFGLAASMLEVDGQIWFSSPAGASLATMPAWPLRPQPL